jgi:pyrroloquinoline quinone biosynthesis protein B
MIQLLLTYLMRPINSLCIGLLITSCISKPAINNQTAEATVAKSVSTTSLIVLGTVQDAGSPHIACTKDCCKELFNNPDPNKQVVSLGVVDPAHNKSYIFEATPDIPRQLYSLNAYAGSDNKKIPDGIFLTHAHIGHYTGLMYLGKEAMNANKVPVYAMPKMKTFLEQNGPWGQLVTNHNIALQELNNQQEVHLTANLKVTPFTVPHRDEYSETVGYRISGPNKKALFIPDIDKWSKWETDIVMAISEVDYAFIDATFYDAAEINYRNISEIPHPFIIESMEQFNTLPASEKKKVYFIHFNHTNPVLNPASKQTKQIEANGFNVARMHDVFEL